MKKLLTIVTITVFAAALSVSAGDTTKPKAAAKGEAKACCAAGQTAKNETCKSEGTCAMKEAATKAKSGCCGDAKQVAKKPTVEPKGAIKLAQR